MYFRDEATIVSGIKPLIKATASGYCVNIFLLQVACIIACDKTVKANNGKSLEFRQARLQTSEKEDNENSVALSRFEIPKRRHCTTGFPPCCGSSRLKPRLARNFCKQGSVALLDPMIQGFVRKRFLLSASPPPLSYFGSRPNFARAKYRSGSVPWSFLASQPHGNACYAGYSYADFTFSVINCR